MTEKRIDELLKRLKKEQLESEAEVFEELNALANENYTYILKSGLDLFLSFLEIRNISGDLQPNVISLMKVLVEREYEADQDLKLLFSRPKLLSILFDHARSGQRDLYTLLRMLCVASPLTVIQLIRSSPLIISPLIQCIASTDITEANEVLVMINGLPGIKDLIEPQIRENIKKFPLSVSLDILISSQEITREMPQEKFEEWVLSKSNNYSILDIQQIFDFYKPVWNSSTAIKLFVNSIPSPILSHMDFCARKEPPKIDVKANDAKMICDSLVSPPIDLAVGSNEEASYYFMRMFVLSLCDIELVSDKAKEVVYSKIQSKIEYLAAAAVQCILFWSMKSFELPDKVVFLLASTILITERSKGFEMLVKGTIRSLSGKHNNAAIIQLYDKDMAFVEENLEAIDNKNVKWLFPHVKANLKSIFSDEYCDESLAVDFVGVISEFFGLEAEEEPKA